MNVSVIMTVFNGENFLRNAIESILAQTYRDFEFIIINDGSTDNSERIINEYADKDVRIKEFSHKNMGMGASLNKGIDIASTDWVIRMDADDIALPNRLERQLSFIENNPDIAVAATLIYYINDQGKLLAKNSSKWTTRKAVMDTVKANDIIGITHPSTIFKKDVVQQVGGYRPDYWPADDIDLWNRILERGYMILVQPEYLLKYRLHTSSISFKGARLARRKLAWLKYSLKLRSEGKDEPTWQEFLHIYMTQPLWRRLNQERKDMAKVLYKASVLNLFRKKYHFFLCNMTASMVLQPRFAISQILSKALPNKSDLSEHM